MRDYSKVSGSFWTRGTGKSLRGDMETQIVALYLMTSPHANMIGVFNMPLGYIQIDTGLSIEGALKGLKKLVQGGFCTYDEQNEIVFVHEMATYQIGEELKPADNRVKDIQKQYDNLPASLIKQGFFTKYAKAFCLVKTEKTTSPSKAPSKPEAGTEAGTEKPKPIVRTSSARFNEFWLSWPASTRKVGKQACERKWKDKKLDDIAEQIIKHVAEMKKTKQWTDGFEPAPLTYINQGRWADEVFAGTDQTANTKPWYISSTGIEAKGKELGLSLFKDEQFHEYKIRIYKAAGITPEMVRIANQDFSQRKQA